MRSLFAIIMLVTNLFNLAGYNLFFQYSIHQSDKRISRQLDRCEYDGNQLVEVKIKLNLPYMSDWGEYQRYDGEVEFQGVHYNYVKRKVAQDTLYMLCIPNPGKTSLYKGINNYLVNANDIPTGRENNQAGKKMISLDEFKQQFIHFDFTITASQQLRQPFDPTNYISTYTQDTPYQPPKSDC